MEGSKKVDFDGFWTILGGPGGVRGVQIGPFWGTLRRP